MFPANNNASVRHLTQQSCASRLINLAVILLPLFYSRQDEDDDNESSMSEFSEDEADAMDL